MREFPATPNDRRQAPRTKLAEIAYIGMGPENGGLVLDVSDGGLSFHSVAPVMPSEKINFLLSLRGHSRIEGAGEVVWTNEMRTVCGLRFTSLSSGAREHLNNWTNQSRMPAAAANDKLPPVPQASTIPVVTSPFAPSRTFFPATPDFIAPLTAPDETSFWHKPVFLWITFVALASVLGTLTFYYGIQVGKSQINAEAAPTASAGSQSNSPAAAPAPVAPPAAVEEAQSIPNEPTSAPNTVAPVPAGSLLNASKMDDGTGPNGQPQDTDGNNPLSREQRAGQMLESGEAELAAAQAVLRGDNGPRDSRKAARLLWSAVGNGNSAAEVILADLYLLGDGVPKSCEQAEVLLTAASKSGNAEAQEKLNELNTNGCQ